MESRFLKGPAGRLDARLHGPAHGPPVLILHPHPLFGGTMGSRLVYDLALALGEAGRRVLRFDFRGVGRSEGTYSEGIGEVGDASAAFDFLAVETGKTPTVVGYSFGAAVACAIAGRRDPACTVLVAMPTEVVQSRLDPSTDAPRANGPVHLILGDLDPFVTVAQAHAVAKRFDPPAPVTVLAGAGHFLEPTHNARVIAAVLAALL